MNVLLLWVFCGIMLFVCFLFCLFVCLFVCLFFRRYSLGLPFLSWLDKQHQIPKVKSKHFFFSAVLLQSVSRITNNSVTRLSLRRFYLKFTNYQFLNLDENYRDININLQMLATNSYALGVYGIYFITEIRISPLEWNLCLNRYSKRFRQMRRKA